MGSCVLGNEPSCFKVRATEFLPWRLFLHPSITFPWVQQSQFVLVMLKKMFSDVLRLQYVLRLSVCLYVTLSVSLSSLIS